MNVIQPTQITANSAETITAVVADPGQNGTFNYTWQITGGGGVWSESESADGSKFTFTPTDQTGYLVQLQVTDSDGETCYDNSISIPGSGGSLTPWQPDSPSVSITETDPGQMAFAGQLANFQISISGSEPDHGAVTVYYRTQDGSAVGDTDYTATGDESMTFIYSTSVGGYIPLGTDGTVQVPDGRQPVRRRGHRGQDVFAGRDVPFRLMHRNALCRGRDGDGNDHRPQPAQR